MRIVTNPEKLIELITSNERVAVLASHTYECRFWRHGKAHGPCTCGAAAINNWLRENIL